MPASNFGSLSGFSTMAFSSTTSSTVSPPLMMLSSTSSAPVTDALLGSLGESRLESPEMSRVQIHFHVRRKRTIFLQLPRIRSCKTWQIVWQNLTLDSGELWWTSVITLMLINSLHGNGEQQSSRADRDARQ